MIQTHGDSFKAQFSLATSKLNSHWHSYWQQSKPNSHWQHQNPILIGNNQNSILIGNIKTQFSLTLLYQKEKSSRLSTLGKEKISCYRSKKGTLQVFMKKPKKNVY